MSELVHGDGHGDGHGDDGGHDHVCAGGVRPWHFRLSFRLMKKYSSPLCFLPRHAFFLATTLLVVARIMVILSRGVGDRWLQAGLDSA